MTFLPRLLVFPVLIAALVSAPAAQRLEPRSFPGADTETYKRGDGYELLIHIFKPPGHTATDRRPAIVFFFGGGWKSGNPGQFEQQCRYLASRGMVALTAEYRILGKHGTPAKYCVTDGKSAVRWVRANAARLGVDPRRVAAGGGSAGGHVAACTGVVSGFDEPGEDRGVGSVPDAMVLFNPALVLAEMPDGRRPFPQEMMAAFPARAGCEPRAISPWHHIAKGQPPTLILHGREDTTVAFWTAEVFAEKMRAAGNRCELAGFAGQAHGFFNHGRGGNTMFRATVKRMDAFLVSLGWLKGADTVDAFPGGQK